MLTEEVLKVVKNVSQKKLYQTFASISSYFYKTLLYFIMKTVLDQKEDKKTFFLK
jgi:hypothetical protein